MSQAAKPIDTRKVHGRRRLRFTELDQVLAEARSLATQSTEHLGNWNLAQVCQHLGIAMQQCVHGTRPFQVPFKLRFFGRLVRRKLLRDGLPSGFRLPPDGAKVLVPALVTSDEGLATLERGLATLRESRRRVAHPVFGAMNVAQWDQFHLRHAEMHLSFIVPGPAASPA